MSRMQPNDKSLKLQVYAVQILFAVSIFIVSRKFSVNNVAELLAIVARYVIYLYVIRASSEAILLAYNWFQTKSLENLPRLYQKNQKHFLIFAAAVGFLVYHQTSLLGEEFLPLYIAGLCIMYPDMEKNKSVISYGTGMACSFYEGYLAHMLPSDGHKFVGFEENIILYESQETVRFPVRRLFLVITKDLYCPPDLKHFNIPNREDLPYLEACKPLGAVIKDMAGVKNRQYRNSAYKIHRQGKPAVYVAAECATPLHTLHLVLKKKALYQELYDIDAEEVVGDFCSMLESILSTSPESRGKCELVHFDRAAPGANLAQTLLDKIQEIEPNFEEIIRCKDE